MTATGSSFTRVHKQPCARERSIYVCGELLISPESAFRHTQDASDTDLFLILSGEFSVTIDGRIVVRKKGGEQVGEMAVVDPRTPRSASVNATCDSVVGRITEPDFSALANRYTRPWRRIGVEFASRLRNGNAPITIREKAGVYALDACGVLSRPRFLPASRLR